MSFLHRVRNFFILLGIFLIVIFVYSDTIQTPYYRYLLFGFIAFALALALHFTTPAAPPPPPSQRFRMLRKNGKEK